MDTTGSVTCLEVFSIWDSSWFFGFFLASLKSGAGTLSSSLEKLSLSLALLKKSSSCLSSILGKTATRWDAAQKANMIKVNNI